MRNKKSDKWYDSYEVSDSFFIDPYLVKINENENGQKDMEGYLQFILSKSSVPFKATFDKKGKLVRMWADCFYRKKDLSNIIKSVYSMKLVEKSMSEQTGRDINNIIEKVNEVSRKDSKRVEREAISEVRLENYEGKKLYSHLLKEIRKQAAPKEDKPITRQDIEDAIRATGSVLDGMSTDVMSSLTNLEEIKGIFAPASDLIDNLQTIYQYLLKARSVQLEAERGLTPSPEDTI